MDSTTCMYLTEDNEHGDTVELKVRPRVKTTNTDLYGIVLAFVEVLYLHK